MIWLVFGLVLLLSFAIVFLITRSTASEQRVQQRLADIGRPTPTADEKVGMDLDLLIKRTNLSDIHWIDSALQHLSVSEGLRDLLAQANANWSVGRFIAFSAFLVVATAWLVAFWVPNPVVDGVAALAAGCIPYFAFKIMRARRLSKFDSNLPEAIDLMSRAMKAGHSINAAIEMVGSEISDPVGPEFRRVFEEQNFGLPLREAMLNMAKRVPLPDLQFLVTAVLVQKETGGNLVYILEKTCAVLRDRQRLQGQLRIYTAQGKLTGWILCALPFVCFLLINLSNPGYSKILLEDPTGQEAVYIGLGLMALGVYAIRKIIDIKV